MECKFGTFLLQRTIKSSSTKKQPPLRIAYRIIRPSLLKPIPKSKQAEDRHSQAQLAPLLVIHGGPSLPSEYLTKLAHSHHLQNRTVIFYDQLGCGWSSIPQQDEWYGVLQMSRDLEELIQHLQQVWKMKKYHLLAHSLGGAIGYEFLKGHIMEGMEAESEKCMPQCLSFVLSNASTNFKLSSSEQMRLYQEFQLQQFQTQMPKKQQQTKKLSIKDEFFRTHICRTSEKPADLESALSRRGKEWSANEYNALPIIAQEFSSTADETEATSPSVGANKFPPVLIVRGQYDFVTEKCTRGWKYIFASSQRNDASELKEVVMQNCAHYPHFEQEDEYALEIENFCSAMEFR